MMTARLIIRRRLPAGTGEQFCLCCLFCGGCCPIREGGARSAGCDAWNIVGSCTLVEEVAEDSRVVGRALGP